MHCWEDGEDHGWPGYICMADDKHDGPHEWVLASEIKIDFL